MPAPGTPLNPAVAKSALRRRIAAQRADLAAAGRILAAPLHLIDRGVAGWRALPPFARVALAAAGSFATARLLRRPGGRAALSRIIPVLLGVLSRTISFRP